MVANWLPLQGFRKTFPQVKCHANKPLAKELLIGGSSNALHALDRSELHGVEAVGSRGKAVLGGLHKSADHDDPGIRSPHWAMFRFLKPQRAHGSIRPQNYARRLSHSPAFVTHRDPRKRPG